MNTKQKGTSFELEVAKRLSRWYDPNSKIDYFWRTHGSGAVATIRKTCNSVEGDIMPIREEVMGLFDYVVFECKRLKNIDLLGCIDRRSKDHLGTLYESCREKYRGSSKDLFLVFKRDRGDTLLITDIDFDCAELKGCVVGSMRIYRFEDFLKSWTYPELLLSYVG